MKKALIIVVVLLALVPLISQLIPVDKSIPAFEENAHLFKVENVPEGVVNSLNNACMDCHSYDTKYPWYTKINLIGRWTQEHVDHGRHHLNFSTWADYAEEDRRKICDEIAEEVKEAKMPLSQYLPMHPEAKLGIEDRKELIAYFEKLNLRKE